MPSHPTSESTESIDLNGKVAIVTGAGRGIGRAIAVGLAEAGARVALLDLDQDGLAETTYAISSAGGTAMSAMADVTDGTSVTAAVDLVRDHFSTIDFLACNAGVSYAGKPTWEIDEDQWDKVLGVNLRGAWLTCRAVIPHMLHRPGGRIVFTASLQGLRAFPEIADYCASKFGLIGLMKVLALELATYQITVNAICPGSVNTEGNRRVAQDMGLTLDEFTRDYRSAQVIPSIMEPEELAAATLWLYSDHARWITGVSLPVPGAA